MSVLLLVNDFFVALGILNTDTNYYKCADFLYYLELSFFPTCKINSTALLVAVNSKKIVYTNGFLGGFFNLKLLSRTVIACYSVKCEMFD